MFLREKSQLQELYCRVGMLRNSPTAAQGMVKVTVKPSVKTETTRRKPGVAASDDSFPGIPIHRELWQQRKLESFPFICI